MAKQATVSSTIDTIKVQSVNRARQCGRLCNCTRKAKQVDNVHSKNVTTLIESRSSQKVSRACTAMTTCTAPMPAVVPRTGF